MLTVEGLVKTYPSEHGKRNRIKAVDGVSFAVDKGEMFTLLGPSGCGKTTTLRAIAGLERPDSGRVVVGDRTLFSSDEGVNIQAHSRGLGMVFQSYAIWPHMTVMQNVAFPLTSRPRRERPDRKTVRRLVQRALDMVELGDLLNRPATNLSGGQQQRLALARALVSESPLLLLDEPLSNLDARLRESMRFELRNLQRGYDITAVYVTHDQSEALGMSTRIAVMNLGRIEQVGTPQEIYNDPKTQFVADFIGTSNFFNGSVVSHEEDRGYLVDIGYCRLWAQSMAELGIGSDVTVSIRPEWIRIRVDSDAEYNSDVGFIKALVVTPEFQGEAIEYLLRIEDRELRARTDPSVLFPHGQNVIVEFDPTHTRILA